MAKDHDAYLLYEYMKKIPFTVRVNIILDEMIDVDLLRQAAKEAFSRFPYFRVKIGQDQKGGLTIEENDRPVVVLPETGDRIALGSEKVNGHLFAVTYKDDSIWLQFSHSICGGYGAFFLIKTLLYQYMTKKYGEIEAPKDLKLPGTQVAPGELAYTDPATLPTDEPVYRYQGGSTMIGTEATLKYLLNPFVRESYYHELEIPTDNFIAYCKTKDGSPYTILTSLMFRAVAKYYRKKEGKEFLAARIAADYRKDIGMEESYRDFVRFIHVRYDWNMTKEPIEKLNMRARGEIIKQSQPELSVERFRELVRVHDAIDALPDRKSKQKYASQHSTFRNDVRDTFTISYVGQTDWGGMDKHIKGIYNITDGNLMLEVNAMSDKLCIAFQMMLNDSKAVQLFCEELKQEGIPYHLSDQKKKILPSIQIP